MKIYFEEKCDALIEAIFSPTLEDIHSTERLIAISHKLKRLNQLICCVKSFMVDQKVELAFDGKKQAARAVRTGIPQGSSISLILFSIYIRFLFSEMKNEHKYANIKMSIFITMLLSRSNRKTLKKIADYWLKLVKKYFHQQIAMQ